jgi:hypothetical protein
MKLEELFSIIMNSKQRNSIKNAGCYLNLTAALSTFFGILADNLLFVIILFYFFLALILKMDCRIPIIAALLLLASCPFLLFQGSALFANEIALYAFYFLAIGALLALSEYLRSNEREK